MPEDPDRYIRDIAASNLLFDTAERASWRMRPSAEQPPPSSGANVWSGAVLGILLGTMLIAFFTSSGITGLAVQEVSYVTFDFTTPKHTYLQGEPITFTVSPLGARASIAYIRPDGGIVMLPEPKFIPREPGTYVFNAVLWANGIAEREIHTVEVIENPLLAAAQRVADIEAARAAEPITV